MEEEVSNKADEFAYMLSQSAEECENERVIYTNSLNVSTIFYCFLSRNGAVYTYKYNCMYVCMSIYVQRRWKSSFENLEIFYIGSS